MQAAHSPLQSADRFALNVLPPEGTEVMSLQCLTGAVYS